MMLVPVNSRPSGPHPDRFPVNGPQREGRATTTYSGFGTSLDDPQHLLSEVRAREQSGKSFRSVLEAYHDVLL